MANSDVEVDITMLLEGHERFELKFDGTLWEVHLYDRLGVGMSAYGKNLRQAMRNLKKLVRKIYKVI